jgi:hypothetical protein
LTPLRMDHHFLSTSFCACSLHTYWVNLSLF